MTKPLGWIAASRGGILQSPDFSNDGLRAIRTGADLNQFFVATLPTAMP